MKSTKPRIVTPEVAQVRLETMCARAEHCTYELREKLWRWQVRGDDADAIINKLIAARYVDDKRFARAFVNDKVRFARWGRRKISQALSLKRIPRDIIKEELEAIDAEVYMANLEHILRVKSAAIADPCTYDGRTRLYRYGISRGFESDLVARVIKSQYV